MLVNSIVFWIFFAVFLLPYFTLIWGRKKDSKFHYRPSFK